MLRHKFITKSRFNILPLIHDYNLELFKISKNERGQIRTETLFIKSCERGALAIAKELLIGSKFVIDIHAKEEKAFRHACAYGQIEIAQWLLQSYPNVASAASLRSARYVAGATSLRSAHNVASATSLRSAHYVRTSGISFL